MKAIETKDIHKQFGTGNLIAKVLKGISISIDTGEFVGMMGKSGAGKSTLLYQISLLDQPTTGDVHVLEQDVLAFDRLQRTEFRLENFGFIFQNYALVPELSAEENVILPLMMLGLDSGESKQLARETLDRLGLGDKYKNLPSQLSGGEQQRVSIARAVAKKPAILFADEPTANLDNASSDTVVEALQQLHQEGQTIVMVTHEHEYTKYCNRVLWMEDGIIEKEIDPYKG